ncbi:MAG: hypothetical protein ACI4TK_11650 [Agathobacter sp.]
MGKQIRLFATNHDWEKLLESIYSRGLYIIDMYGNAVSSCQIKDILNGLKSHNYYITKDNWKIDYRDTFVAFITSELIQFHGCRPSPETMIDLYPVEKHFQKGCFTVIGANESDKYHQLLDEYMNNPIRVPNPNYIENGYEHGRFWCPTSYYDNNGNVVYQNKDVIKEYNFIVRLIKKEAIISEDKAFYIMPDAYQRYKENSFIPCSGRYSIDFK